jgi:CheY-like chemotaxis protein
VRVAALTSAVRTALRARERQYQIRGQLMERERADRRKDEFLATLAHELRNPLAPIRSSLDLLRLAPESAPVPEILGTMDRQVNHMMRLIDDLMDVSRVTRGKIHLRRQSVDMAEMMGTAIEISRPEVDAAGHRLTVVLPPAGVTVDGDPVRLAQVFSNLLNNAVKYTNPGGEIRFAAHVSDGQIEVSVSDSGIGIAAEALPHLFEMFYQAADGQRLHAGLGIGLTLVHTMVEMHGGEVIAGSDGPGRGSRFTVRLPLERKAAAPAPLPASASKRPAALPGLPRVIVVDDNRDAADSLAMLLQVLGADVRVAHDGAAALEAFDQFHPAAMFLDIGMPGMDGYELAGRVRARPQAENTLLVALTGWGQERDRARTRAAGFAHHLVKPADASRLRALLASLAA